MNKQEFFIRYDEYIKRQRKNKWSYTLISIFCLLATFGPEPISSFFTSFWEFPSSTFAIFAGLSGGVALKMWFEIGDIYLLNSAKDIINGVNDT